MKKISLYQLLKNNYPDKSDKENYAAILCGDVVVNNEKIKDPSCKVNPDSSITFIRKHYVSRGGYKLEKALEVWKIDVKGKIILDAGSSTGGFTDCLLQFGAGGVHSVDVGYNQLDYSLRKNSCVFVHERKNIMTIENLEPAPDFGVADLSFRSIKGAAKKIINMVNEKTLIALIKPQFESDRYDADFDGVVKDQEKLKQILRSVISALNEENVFLKDIIESPIEGKKGNREFLAYLTENPSLDESEIERKISLLF
jgi:23S rRNA (cytidine1920-2'-O)/16S rRNA (cytidine1409-2'-O)-methyltransferase